MKLKDLKKEEEKITKRLEKYKNLIINRLYEFKEVEKEKFNQTYFAIKLSNLNNGSLRVEDNVLPLQFKNYIDLIKSASSFQKLYETLSNYKEIMHEKLKINISDKFSDIMNQLLKEIE